MSVKDKKNAADYTMSRVSIQLVNANFVRNKKTNKIKRFLADYVERRPGLDRDNHDTSSNQSEPSPVTTSR